MCARMNRNSNQNKQGEKTVYKKGAFFNLALVPIYNYRSSPTKYDRTVKVAFWRNSEALQAEGLGTADAAMCKLQAALLSLEMEWRTKQ